MGLLDGLFSGGGGGGGLLDFLRNNAINQQFGGGLQSDQAQYGSPMGAMGQMPSASMPSVPMMAQSQAAPPQQPAAQPQPMQAPSMPQGPGFGDRIGASLQSFANSGGPLPALANGLTSLISGQRSDPTGVALQQQQQTQNLTFRALVAKGVDPQIAMTAVAPGNTEMLKQIVDDKFKSKEPQNLGGGYVLRHGADKAERLYTPDDATPNSVKEYQYYRSNPTPGQPVMDYGTWASKKARDSANNIVNNVDMNSGMTYDKQLAEGLGKSHAALANGVESAQTRARDIAAMQGAVDAIQKNGGSTGGLGQQQVLDLKKTINSGMTALGVDKPFNESDLADKEFLTKFNRSMAGAQAKDAVGSRVTNFEMSNFLKANPGLDMSVTGNQRLLGIQSQIEERNIAVGNAIRDATAAAISEGKKINPVTVQKIIKDYDDEHHIKDVVTGQDLTQSYTLPEFQKSDTNASMAKSHEQNLKAMEKTIGGVTYEQRNGQWYPKAK